MLFLKFMRKSFIDSQCLPHWQMAPGMLLSGVHSLELLLLWSDFNPAEGMVICQAVHSVTAYFCLFDPVVCSVAALAQPQR